MNHLDELLANPEAILRLIVSRNAMRAASRACDAGSRYARYWQTKSFRWSFLRAVETVCLGGFAVGLLAGARWCGYRLRYRTRVARPLRR